MTAVTDLGAAAFRSGQVPRLSKTMELFRCNYAKTASCTNRQTYEPNR